MKLSELVKVFNQIKSTSSRNEKIVIIRKYKDDKIFCDNLRFLLDNNIVTGISSSKLNKNVGVVSAHETCCEAVDWFLLWENVKSWLIKHPTGSNHDILVCQRFLKSIPEEYREFFEQMITKKLKLGCDYKTANEAIPNFIWTYETQQAYPISDKNRPKNSEWFSLSDKLNGINGGFLNGKCLSRQGKEICGMNHIIDELSQLGIDTNKYYVNGELIRINNDDIPDDENFRLTTSIVNSDAEKKTEIGFIFYEIIPMNDFLSGECKTTYKNRLKIYKNVQKKIEELGLNHVKFVDQYYDGTDQSKIQEWLDYADTHNKEGIMLNKDTSWQAKRNNGILKVKSFKACDIRCVGVEEGDGKNRGTLGRINCDYKGYTLGVGSGFSDSQREYYWTHPEEIVGKIVTVKYKVETKTIDKSTNTYKLSLQFPIFICVREDKIEESYE